MRTGAREVLRRVGGPYSVTWFAFWLTLFQNVVHHVSASPEIEGYWPLRFLAIACSQVAMFGVLLLARATILRDAGERPRPLATLLSFAVAGAMRGVVLGLLLATTVPLTSGQIAVRPLTSVFTYTVTLAFCSYVVSVFQENKRALGRAEQTQVALMQARDVASRDLAEQRMESMEQVRSQLLSQFDQLTSTSPQLRPQQLDDFLDEALRPTSHRLAAGIERWQPRASQAVDARLRVSQVLISIGRVPPFSPVPQAIFSVAFCLALLLTLPMSRGLLVLLGIFASTGTILTLGNKVHPWLSRLRTPMRVAGTAGLTLVVSIAVAASWAWLVSGTSYYSAGIVYGLFLTPLLAGMGIAAKAALSGQRELEAELVQSQEQLRWDIVRVHQLQWRQQHQLARALHGPVQTVIIAEATGLAHGPSELRSASRLRGVLADALAATVDENVVPDLDTTVESLTRSWAPLCRVEADITTAARAVDADGIALACLADLLGEAVANAVRHGEAGAVHIAVDTSSDNVLRVEVVDDGQGRGASPRYGLGSQMLDDCCLEWRRAGDAEGTRLVFLLPFQGAVVTGTSNPQPVPTGGM